MITRILNAMGYEKREVLNPAYFPGNFVRGVPAGTFVSSDAVLSNSAVAVRAIDLKATLIAATAFKVFRMLESGGRERVRDSAVARLIKRPNDFATQFEFFELVSRSLDIWGNFYARIVRNGRGQPTALIPIHPTAVTVERIRASGRIRYRISEASGETLVLLDDEMLHVKNSTTDGLVGQSPIQIARGILGRTIAENVTAATMAQSSFRPAGFITVPNAKIDPKSKKALSESMLEDASKPSDVGTIKVLEGGAKFTPYQFSAGDAQFLESRTLSNADTARIFSVPPASLGLTETVSYGSAAQAAQDLVTATLNPLAARIEAAFERALLPSNSDLFLEFDLDSLLRADPSTRWTNYLKGRQSNALSPNDVRAMENMPPVEGGDDYSFAQNASNSGGGQNG
jgi:HK97 family phage portal protein